MAGVQPWQGMCVCESVFAVEGSCGQEELSTSVRFHSFPLPHSPANRVCNYIHTYIFIYFFTLQLWCQTCF